MFSQGWFWAIIALLAVAIGVGVFFGVRTNASKLVAGMQYKSRLLNTSGQLFFKLLTESLGHDFFVLAKVRVLDVVEPTAVMNGVRYRKLKKELESESFDYVICKQSDFSTVGVIKLEHLSGKPGRRNALRKSELVDELCKVSKLKLFYLDARQQYKDSDIRRIIIGSDPVDNEKSQSNRNDEVSTSVLSEMTQTQSVHSEQLGLGSCPKCNGSLVTKVAVTGKHIGERFLMCRKYPYCDYRVLMSDENLAKIRAESKRKTTVKKGFADWNG